MLGRSNSIKPEEREAGRRSRAGIHCVFLTCFEDDFRVFAQLVRYGGIRMYRAETIEQADFLLTVTESTVLLSDTIFLDGTCNLAAEMIGVLHPRVSLVVAAENAAERCWERAVRLSIGTISKPLRMDELCRAIRTAHEIAEETAWRLSSLNRGV